MHSDRIAVAATLLATVTPALALGGGRPDWQVAALAPVSLVGLALAWRTSRGHGLAIPWAPLSWVLALGVLAILQALPLGEWAPAMIGGPGHRRADEILALLGAPQGHRALSLDPPGSLASAARSLGATGVLLAAGALSCRKGFRRTLLIAIGGLGVLEVLVGVLQGPLNLLDLSPLFDHPFGEGIRTTLRNPNHAAALLNLATFCWIAWALDPGRPGLKPLGALFAAITGLGSLTTWSRAGGAVLGTLLLLFPLALTLRKNRVTGHRGPGRLDVLRLLALGLLALLLLAAFQQALSAVHQGSLLPERPETKNLAWGQVLAMIWDHPLAGVGRGAFGMAFQAYNDIAPGFFFDFAENGLLQLLADLGIPLGLALALWGLGIGAMLARRALVTSSLLAVWFGLLAVALQNLADFSLEIPGVALPFAALVGLLAGRSPPEPRVPRADPKSLPRSFRVGVPLALAVLGILPPVLAARVLPEQPPAARQRLARALLEPRADEDFQAALQREAAAHPADPEIPRLAARRAFLSGDLEAALLLDDAALLLAPWHPGARRDRIRDLRAAGRLEEALQEVRILWLQDPAQRAWAIDTLLSWSVPADLLARQFSTPPELLGDLRGAMKRRGLRGPLVALLTALRDLDPDRPEAWEALGREAVEASDLAVAEECGWWLVSREPDAPAGWYLLGRVAWERGQTIEALALFRQAAEDPTGDAGLFEARCLLALRRYDDVSRHLDALRPRLARDPLRLARWHLLQASLAERLGAPIRVLESLNQAIRSCPGLAEARIRKARLLQEMGRVEEARREFQEARRLEPTNPAIEELRRALGCDDSPAPRGCDAPTAP